jgi:hypothetical protein
VTLATVAAESTGTAQPTEGLAQPNPASATEAFHLLTSEIAALSTSAQTVVLSNEPVSLSVALQQTFTQLGYAPNVVNSADIVPVSSTDDVKSSSDQSTPFHFDLLNTAPTAAPVVAPITAASSNPASSSASSDAANPTITQTVDAFLQHTPAFEVTISGSNVVIIDTNIADIKSPNFGVMTFDLSDGSTLSIVGILPPHAHALAA